MLPLTIPTMSSLKSLMTANASLCSLIYLTNNMAEAHLCSWISYLFLIKSVLLFLIQIRFSLVVLISSFKCFFKASQSSPDYLLRSEILYNSLTFLPNSASQVLLTLIKNLLNEKNLFFLLHQLFLKIRCQLI